MKKEIKAGTEDEQTTTADFSTSASVEANPMLSATISIKDGQILISEFMGWSKHPKYGEDYLINKDKNRKLPPHWTGINHEGKLSDFDYNTSWDWLVPVYGKAVLQLKEIHTETNKSGYSQCPTGASSMLIKLNKEFQNYCFQNAIDKAFDVVCQAINFINSVSVGSR